jgi:hypothetical protein
LAINSNKNLVFRMLREWVIKELMKYSFIKDYKLKNGCWEIIYTDFNKGRFRTLRLPLRTTKSMLEKSINDLKKSTGYSKLSGTTRKSYLLITSQFDEYNMFTESYLKPEDLIVLDETTRVEYDMETGKRIKDESK